MINLNVISMILKNLKNIVYDNLEPNPNHRSLSFVGKTICFFIFLSFINSILATENTFYLGHKNYFIVTEKIFLIVFLVEYLLRVWVCNLNPIYKQFKYKRLRYICSFYSILDLLAVTVTILPYVITSPSVLRVLRLIKILRVMKFARFSKAILRLKHALSSRAPDLILTMSVALVIMIFAASLLYFIESDINPNSFGSIPRAMWWAVITLTTVGYGDSYPITVLGKVIGASISIIGLGLIAMPAGILAAAFSDVMKIERKDVTKKKKKL